MFLGLPFDNPDVLQNIALILNTVVLIVLLLAVEFIYSEAPKEKRRQLRHLYPVVFVLAGLLVFAMYKQVVV